jgi:UDP-N-acetylmuramyl tripeptide synthase
LEAAAGKVNCNWAGANMATGVACALLPKGRGLGVFEVDELSTARVVPQLRPDRLVLLNLFRDQLDRCGELDRIQDTLAAALASSPGTDLVVNADDPLCMGVAERVRDASTRVVRFGVAEDLHLPADRVTGGAFCQRCGAPLRYDYHQYGQLGSYACPACPFGRGELDYEACDVVLRAEGASFAIRGPRLAEPVRLEVASGGAYMVYNVLAAFVALHGVLGDGARDALARVLADYRPQNGRLQRFDVRGRRVTLNLAKNPTGFNQNMALLAADPAPKVVYIAINDDYNDGKDVSWLWDVDFELLAGVGPARVFVGGHRANDVQVRLKYAGVASELAPTMADVLGRTADLPAEWGAWALTNYAALWPVKAELEGMGETR